MIETMIPTCHLVKTSPRNTANAHNIFHHKSIWHRKYWIIAEEENRIIIYGIKCHWINFINTRKCHIEFNWKATCVWHIRQTLFVFRRKYFILIHPLHLTFSQKLIENWTFLYSLDTSVACTNEDEWYVNGKRDSCRFEWIDTLYWKLLNIRKTFTPTNMRCLTIQ